MNGVGPNLEPVLSSWWGNYADSTFLAGWIARSSGILVGTNPPYAINDFLAVYPWFLGPAVPLRDTVTVAGNPQITVVNNTSELLPGMLVTGPNISVGSVIVSIDGDNLLTISVTPTVSATATGAYYPSPTVPLPVISIYIALASCSLPYARWECSWYLGMAMYIAHFCTMWLRSYIDPNSNPTAAQVAQAGFNQGMLIAKSVGDVSGSYENLMADFGAWGAWMQTSYGSQLITMAKIIGMGMLYTL